MAESSVLFKPNKAPWGDGSMNKIFNISILFYFIYSSFLFNRFREECELL
jgi:hypothetical protein